jgi:acyl transferase domain-containing protein/NADPH:quinone reductase-like Zn-dependent oxidoreductase/thioesterase domain-containing protein
MADTATNNDIAVIGASGRFPGAANLAQFWHNLRHGVESVTFFTEEELLAAGEAPTVLRDPAYVKAQPVLEDFDRFDAAFFGFSPLDAAVMDPQHRLFLEVGWEALEDAGYESASFPGTIGVFGTCGMNAYMMFNLVNNRNIMESVGEWLVRHTGNDMNFLATRLSYALDLKGPSMNVQTACSSALVAIHLACQSLLSGECDMALAGGANIVLPPRRGYLTKQGEILSPDGHCRPFDARARGTLFGSGAGIVVLRRLADAVPAGDRILAVVKGSAINNDGCGKVGYLAPGVEGQARAITEAIAVSGIDPETISYVEAHGTGTVVGDPIEVAALTQAYRQFTSKKGFCALGSVKSNIGHLGEAAGVASFLKTVLALVHRELPPSLHYEAPNPQIDFDASPFVVNARLAPWTGSNGARRAGITSLGAGGTNCHVIVEEASPTAPPGRARPRSLLLLSARTEAGLETASANLATHLRAHPDTNLADVAYTLHLGRKAFAHRRALVCRDCADAIAALEAKQGLVTSSREPVDRPVAFLFPGQGAQYPNMGRDVYDNEPVFRAELDRCAEILKAVRGIDLLGALFTESPSEQARRQLNQTALAQPALFAIEYALAKLWMSWGVQPRAFLGHSIGEYVAACFAGVFSLADALVLVADRGRLMQEAPRGAMLAVNLQSPEVEQRLAHDVAWRGLCLAVVNAPDLAVVSGPNDRVAQLETALAGSDVRCQRLQTSHGFHSAMMDSILAPFAERVRRVALHPPTIPYLSNLSGTWIKAEEATDPQYWVRHLRGTVRFSECLSTLLANPDQILLEVGPGRTLRSLVNQQPAKPAAVLHSLGAGNEAKKDLEVLFKAYGQLWVLGCELDAAAFYREQQRRRVSLPTYPFERQRHWIEPDSPAQRAATVDAMPSVPAADGALTKKPDIADWFWLPTWKRVLPPAPAGEAARVGWLIFLDECGLGADLIEQLRMPEEEVSPPPAYLEITAPGDVDSITVRPEERRAPAAGQVEIRVRAAALNFADVLKAVGAFPEAPFGMECAGVIERVGPEVAGFRPGDEVVSIGPGSFRSYVIRDVRQVSRKPDFLSIEEAVTLPAAFMTVWYAMHHVGQLAAGEKVLIHAASGGVGLAAVQVARLAGAQVFATAGSKEKRAFLAGLGIRHVFSSQSPDFSREVMQRTGGRGVDMVLNSLTGEFIPRGLSVLAPGGRFLELGKRELYSPAQLKALNLRAGVSYHPIDLTRILRDDPGAYGRLLGEVVEQARTRRFEPLPRSVFPFTAAPNAFRLMLQRRHIGKVVLSMRPMPPPIYCVRAGKAFQRLNRHEYVVNPGRAADYTELLAALEAEGASIGRIVHFWNVTSAKARAASVDSSLERGFFSLVWLAQALGRRGWGQGLDLTIMSTGVQQVAGETRMEPVKAALLGTCRVIPREFPNVAARSIDVPCTAPGSLQRKRLVWQLLAEVAAAPQERIVAYRNAERWVQRYEPARIRAANQPMVCRQGGVYLITGGLGGLGLELAEDLCNSAGANVVLVGRSALPPRGEWQRWLEVHPENDPTSERVRRVLRCEAAGGNVHIIAADVTDAARMRAVVKETHKRFGPINGVIHAAGTLDDGLIQLKSGSAASAVLAPKVKGALVLDAVLRGEALDFFALFSSVSSILGLEGQVDYAGANAFLDAFATYRAADCAGQTVAVNWGAWQEVGMAARAARTPRGDHARSAQAPPPRHPWLEQREDADQQIAFTTAFNRSRQWLLDEHAVRGGDALIPGTGFLELARAALAEIDPAEAVEISSVVFEAPFVVAAGETKDLTITLARQAAGWAFSMRSGAGKVTHVSGTVAPRRAERRQTLDLAALAADCDGRAEELNGFLQQSFMDFGRRWGNVRQIRWGRDQALVTLELRQEFAPDLEMFRLHPALLDMATGGAQPLIPGFDVANTFYVPFSYGRLVLWGGLHRKLHSWIRLREAGARGFAVFDVTLCDANGSVVADVSEFVMKLLPDSSVLARQHEATGAKTLQPQEPLPEALRHGIAPQEGIEAFKRILAAGVAPQVVVSSVDLPLWLKQVDASSRYNPAALGQVSSRDEDGDGSRPGGGPGAGSEGLEQRLAELFSCILGVEKVGLRDDFFELGGHSLLAVRLLARIEKQFGKAVPLPVLFQSPTIEGLVRYLRPEEGQKEEEPRVLVPLNEQGSGLALFCVHSMGGEVMSFRHLCRLLGPEQRFYGLAPTPALRNTDFASSIESMARHYVDALVAFQPEGPYLLAGWSAGSTIALEMAQQLRARGHDVPLVIALDGSPYNTGTGTSRANPLYYWKVLRNIPYWVLDDLMVDFSVAEVARRVRQKLVFFCRKAAAALRGQKDTSRFSVDGFIDLSMFSDTQGEFMRSLFAALHAYVPKPYPGPVLLYKSTTQPLYHLLEVEPAWRSIAAELEVVSVRGTHISIVQEPYVRPIAAHLRERMLAFGAAGGQPPLTTTDNALCCAGAPGQGD